ncbi:SDR family NAD(P)-dependent oxidoreductase [Streptomyces sp. NPDC001393]
MSERMLGRAAVVTGCGSGIGLAITKRFLEEGATVLGFDVDAGATNDISSERFRFRRGSVSDESELEAALEAVTGWAGRLDVMVNNAGIQVEGTLDETDVDDFDKVLAVNARGVFLGTRLAARRMGAGGSIVNLGSVLGRTGDPQLPAYCASKSAVINLTEVAAATYGSRGIRVNSICPGAVRTDMVKRVWAMADDPGAAQRAMEEGYPLGRIAEPAEIAKAAVFLATDDSSAVTGTALVVDCGLSARGILPR